jgi:hypothetical protein
MRLPKVPSHYFVLKKLHIEYSHYLHQAFPESDALRQFQIHQVEVVNGFQHTQYKSGILNKHRE